MFYREVSYFDIRVSFRTDKNKRRTQVLPVLFIFSSVCSGRGDMEDFPRLADYRSFSVDKRGVLRHR